MLLCPYMCGECVLEPLDLQQHALASQRGTSVLASDGALQCDDILHVAPPSRGRAGSRRFYGRYRTKAMQFDAMSHEALTPIGNIPQLPAHDAHTM